ncbi:MAG: hypothetical protein JNM09_28735 [Blastocatellia bacterium]|nr:hypothetical protein [Blastocatellia bacterium]
MNRTLLIAFFLLLAFSPAVSAQNKKRTKTTPSRTRPAPPAPTPPPPDTQKEANEVATTLKALTKFLFLYGKIANGLEVAEDQAKRSRVSTTVIEQNIRNKNGVQAGIAGLKEQVDKLGQILQAHPKLQVPYVNLAGVTQKIVEAQGLVQNNQFDEAGRSMVTATERLVDILSQVK